MNIYKFNIYGKITYTKANSVAQAIAQVQPSFVDKITSEMVEDVIKARG